jgi:hypothetical protein
MAPEHSHRGRPEPFSEMATMWQQLRERELHATVDGSLVERLARAAEMIGRVHATAVEMQLGAEGFDNTHAAGLYAHVQEHVLAAARELVEATAALKAEAERWADLRG